MQSPLELAPEYIRQLGTIAVRWTALENGLADLFGRFLRVDHAGDAAYFAIGTFSQRLSVISSIAAYSIENDRDARVVDKLLRKVGDLWGQRNKFFHSHYVHQTTYEDGVIVQLYADGGKPLDGSALDPGELRVVKSEFGYLRTRRQNSREFVPINLAALANHSRQVSRRGRQLELVVKSLDTGVVLLRPNSPTSYSKLSPRASANDAIAHKSKSGAFTSRVQQGWPSRD